MGNASSSVAEIKKRSDSGVPGRRAAPQHDAPKRPGLGGKQMSSKRFKKTDAVATQWKIFNDLDVQDDKMMLELAVFLHRLVQSFPGGQSPRLTESSEAPQMTRQASDYFTSANIDGDDKIKSGLDLESITVEVAPMPPLVRIGSVDVRLGAEVDNLQDYSLPKDPLTLEMVHEVLQVYGSGGKLSIKTVRRILRDAYKLLKEMPNVVRVNLDNPKESVVVVGDLHGQLPDLLHLLQVNGMPSTSNKYIFNGDFVDRGTHGVEILVILFMLITVLPGSVVLNRGNHEDFGLCCVYGFQKECQTKYNDVIFSMFCEMFRFLPVCSIIHNKVLVIHGGLFHREGVTISELERIDRTAYVVPSRQSEEEEEDAHMTADQRAAKDLRTLMHCALWSDPDLEPSLPVPQPNPRGAGVLFGPDLTEHFLGHNGLDMVVRSHECVEEGFDLPFEDEMEGTCATIFSASNYGGSMNKGATMRFSWEASAQSFRAGGEMAQEPVMYYSLKKYCLKPHTNNYEAIQKVNQIGLSGMVLRKKRALLEAFSQVDKAGSGLVSKERWAAVMQNITGMQIAWVPLIPLLVDTGDMQGQEIDYKRFMNKFHVQLKNKASTAEGGELFAALYTNRESLEAIFRFFDEDCNGSISREEFRKGCELINQRMPDGSKLENPDLILDMMDMDKNDAIDINEFFETFRIMDAKDGNVDGRISLAG